MAVEGVLRCIPGLKAGADLSTHQYKFVKLSAAFTVVLAAAVTDDVIGVLQDKPATGNAAAVAYTGETKIKTAIALAAGARIGTAADGRATTSVATDREAGIMILATAAADEIGTALINLPGGLKA